LGQGNNQSDTLYIPFLNADSLGKCITKVCTQDQSCFEIVVYTTKEEYLQAVNTHSFGIVRCIDSTPNIDFNTYSLIGLKTTAKGYSPNNKVVKKLYRLRDSNYILFHAVRTTDTNLIVGTLAYTYILIRKEYLIVPVKGLFELKEGAN